MPDLLLAILYILMEFGGWIAWTCHGIWMAMVEVIRYRRLEREEMSRNQRK